MNEAFISGVGQIFIPIGSNMSEMIFSSRSIDCTRTDTILYYTILGEIHGRHFVNWNKASFVEQ